MDKEYLAHSAHDGFPAQTYLNHVQNVHDDAARYAKEAAAFAAKQEDGTALVSAVTNAASLHDLGKLEEENQAALHAGISRICPSTTQMPARRFCFMRTKCTLQSVSCRITGVFRIFRKNAVTAARLSVIPISHQRQTASCRS